MTSEARADLHRYILAWTVVVGFFAVLVVLMFTPLPEAAVGPVNQLFGALTAAMGMVVNFFFGSSDSSRRKTELLGRPPG